MINSKYIKNFIQIVIIIVLLMFVWSVGKDWLRPRIIKALGGYTQSTEKEYIDTISIKYELSQYKYDSVRTANVKLSKQLQVANYKFQYALSNTSTKGKNNGTIKDTSLGVVTMIDSVLPMAYISDNAIVDTLLTGSVRSVINPIDGKIVEQKLLYSFKKPIFTTKTITIEKTKETTLSDKPKSYFGIGGTITGFKQVGLQGIYQLPSKWQFQGGILWNTNNYLPDKSNKAAIVTISKLF